MITMSGVIDVQYMKMKYKGFEFDVNPKDFKTCMNKSSVKYTTVYSEQICVENGRNCVSVSGKGCFVGENAANKAFEMVRVYNKKGSDYLFLPNSVPLKMHFTSLHIQAAMTGWIIRLFLLRKAIQRTKQKRLVLPMPLKKKTFLMWQTGRA